MPSRLIMFNGELRHRCEKRGGILYSVPCILCGVLGPNPGEVIEMDEASAMRTFDTGATRNQDDTKLDPEGFYSPLVIERFAQYLHKHRKQADGKTRDSDNWQKGMPLSVYMKSAWRHFLAWWKAHRGYATDESIEDSICALIFNAQGYLYERLRNKTLKMIEVRPHQSDPAILDPSKLQRSS